MINSPMGPGDEIIVPGDLECSCNMVSSIWSVERKTYRSMCDIWGDSDSDSESESEGNDEVKWSEVKWREWCPEWCWEMERERTGVLWVSTFFSF